MDVLSLGIGGALGAILALLAAGARLSGSWLVFSEAFRSFIGGRNDPASEEVRTAFELHEASVRVFTEAVARLRRALGLR
jgi:hypothetical protein